MDSLRVLLLTQIVPYPPDSGPRIKTYHVLRYLASRGHRVVLATFARADEADGVRALRAVCAQVHVVPMRRSRVADVRDYARALAGGRPFLVERDSKRAMHDLVRRLTGAEPFDIVHADQLTMGQYALDARSGRRIFDAHNAVWSIVDRARMNALPFIKPVLALEAARLKRYEAALCSAVDRVLAVSADDRANLAAVGAPADVRGKAVVTERELKVTAKCASAAAFFDGGTWSLTPDGEKNLPKSRCPDAVKAWESRQFAKWIDVRSPQARVPLGERFEIVPVTDLATAHNGDKATFRVLLDGTPVSGATLAIDHKPLGETDSAGEVRVKIRATDIESVSASLRRPLRSPDADAEVWEASLTFEVAK